MFEQHFGLERRPFRAAAAGSDVFVGPQTAKTMQALKKALAARDAAVAVSGATGVGKSTLVNHALMAIPGTVTIIRIGRMQLRHDEVLEFLLDELGASNVPASTIRRITEFRRLLGVRKDAGERVVIVIEDAVRIGTDALAEIEALTAADGGDCEGANVVLMGDEGLKDVIGDAAISRLKQRVRLFHSLEALTAPELVGYLRHCFRLSGGDFDRIFADNGGAAIHALSDGVPRIANNLVESAMNAAADQQLTRIDTALIARVAEDEYGLTADLPEPQAPAVASPAPAAAVETTAAAAPEPVEIPAVEPEPVTAAEPEPVPEPTPAPAAEAEPVAIPAVKPEPAAAQTPEVQDAGDGDDPEVPELIQDTLPDLEVLAPEVMQAAADPQPAATDATPAAGRNTVTDVEVTTEPDIVIQTATDVRADVSPEPTATAEPDVEEDIDEAPSVAAEILAAADRVDRELANAAASPEAAPVAAPDAPEPAPVKEAAHELTLDSDAPAAADGVAASTPTAEPDVSAPPAAPPAPNVAEAAAAAADKKTESGAGDEIPTLFDSGRMDKPEAETVSDADRDPTLAELKPDLDALEAAMAELAEPQADVATAEPDVSDVADVPELAPDDENATTVVGEGDAVAPVPTEPPASDMTVPELPQITLDKSIKEDIAEATAALEQHDATIAENEAVEQAAPAPVAAKNNLCLKSTTELRHIATGLQKAESLDDIDDAMAETLFGSGITTIAAKVLAAGPDGEPANESLETDSKPESGGDLELELVADESAAAPVAAPETPNANKTELEKEFMDVYGDDALEVSLQSDAPQTGLDSSASQRLATVRALNAERQQPAAAPQPAAGAATPASFEDQIKSMDQGLAPAASRPTAVDDDDDDEDDEPKKGGFFSRFRRS